jgi:hypothetical protein
VKTVGYARILEQSDHFNSDSYRVAQLKAAGMKFDEHGMTNQNLHVCLGDKEPPAAPAAPVRSEEVRLDHSAPLRATDESLADQISRLNLLPTRFCGPNADPPGFHGPKYSGRGAGVFHLFTTSDRQSSDRPRP